VEAQIMNLSHRRQFLHLAAGTVVLSVIPLPARAQSYPSRPVRIVNGFAAGGVTDILARLIAQRLSDRLGQQFLVENRTGAATNIATEAVANAPPDGYTLLVATAANAINATLYEKLNFNFIRDLAPVGSFGIAPHVMVVNPTVPARTVGEFIAYAKANPDRISYASGGVGSPPHAAGELFKMMAGVNMTHVPYRGTSPAIPDMINGRVQMIFGYIPDVIEYVRSGNLRALAVTTATRLDMLPDLPTVSDSLPAFEATSLQGLCAPRNTPVAIVEKMNSEINTALADKRIKARFEELGIAPLSGSPTDFGKLIAEETEKWGRVVKFAGMKAD
jgi:tripartite-type tricarboxylate transporter receptor subunit TctC